MSHPFLIPDHIDPEDPVAGRETARQLLRAVDEVLSTAQHTRQGGTVQEAVPLAVLWQLDRALAAAGNYHLFGIEGEAAHLATEVRARILKGCQDAFAAQPSVEWRCLWDVYRELHGDCSTPLWGLTVQHGELRRDEKGLLGSAVVEISPAVQRHPWHPLAWPFIAARFRPHDRSRLLELSGRLLVPSVQEKAADDASGQPPPEPTLDETADGAAAAPSSPDLVLPRDSTARAGAGGELLRSDLEAARDAALRCVNRVRAIVALQSPLYPSFRAGLTEALSSTGWVAVERVGEYLGGEEVASWNGYAAKSFHHIARELALRAANAYDNLAEDAAALEQFVTLDYRDLAMRIGHEHERALRRVSSSSPGVATSGPFDDFCTQISGVEKAGREETPPDARGLTSELSVQVADQTRRCLEANTMPKPKETRRRLHTPSDLEAAMKAAERQSDEVKAACKDLPPKISAAFQAVAASLAAPRQLTPEEQLRCSWIREKLAVEAARDEDLSLLLLARCGCAPERYWTMSHREIAFILDCERWREADKPHSILPEDETWNWERYYTFLELCRMDCDADPELSVQKAMAERLLAERHQTLLKGASSAARPPGVLPEASTENKSVAPSEAPTGSKASAESGMSWQEAAERMKRLRAQGQPWTSYGQLAELFGCSSGTIHKAVRKTPELQSWAKRQAATPRAQSLNDVVTDRTAQSAELNPEDDAAIREFIEGTDRETKAWFLALSCEDQLEFVNDPDKYQRVLGRKP